jgi:UDP-2-acetamido-2,6-beta-L-arabino-hexul-4-ose reductase
MNRERKTVIVEKLAVFSDERGVVFNPIEMRDLRSQKNLHVVTSSPQAIRGNHYHRKGTEILIIMGPALVRIRENNNRRDIVIPDRSIYRLNIPPGVPHAVKHTGSTSGLLLSFNTVDYDPENPDVVQEDLF